MNNELWNESQLSLILSFYSSWWNVCVLHYHFKDIQMLIEVEANSYGVKREEEDNAGERKI